MFQNKPSATARLWRILRVTLCFVLLMGGMVHAPTVGAVGPGLGYDQDVVAADTDSGTRIPEPGRATDNACVDAGTCSLCASTSRGAIGLWPSKAHSIVAETLPQGALVFFLFRPPKNSVQA